jgi:hypothetical protein
MSYVDWMIKGPKFTSCNCAYGCPCEFNALPSYGVCEGVECMEIEEGYFGDIRLDGLRVGATYRWPGAMHFGHGEVQGFIDDRADEAQIDALSKILGGEEQEPNTVFNIYGSTFETEHDPVFAPIEFEWNMDARTARFKVDGHLDMTIEPIKNPVTGADHFAQIVLPKGWEYKKAEMGSGSFTGTGVIQFDHKDSYGALFYVAYGPYGMIE